MEILWAFLLVNVFVVPWRLLCDYHPEKVLPMVTLSEYHVYEIDTLSKNNGGLSVIYRREIPVYLEGRFWGYIYLEG